MALKGLTAEDRASWEKKYALLLQGRTPQEIENAWVNFHISETHISDADYNKIKDLSIEEKEAYYNASIQGDTAEKPTKSKEEVDAMVQEALPNNLVNKLSLDKLEGTSPIEKDDILSPFYDVEASEKVEEDKKARNALENLYKVALGKYDELYERSAAKAREGENMVKAVALEVSPHYKMFKGTHLIPSDKLFWQDESKKFLANMETYGEEKATYMLYSNLKEVAASNQTLYEKYSAGFNMLGADALSSTLFIVGAVTSPGAFAEKLIRGAYKDTPWYQLPLLFLDTTVDNPINRYALDVLTYGTWTPSQIAELKKIGLSKKPILATKELENTLFNANTLPELLGLYGFTLGTMGVGVGLGAGTNAIMNLARAKSLANTTLKTALTSLLLYLLLKNLRAVESGITRYGIPALLGTGEGVLLGLETKIRVLEDGNAYVENIYRKQLEEEFSKKYNEEFEYRFQQALDYYKRTTSLTPRDPELGGGFLANTTLIKSNLEIANEVLDLIYNETVASLSGSYLKMLNLVEENATKSGIITTVLASSINGIINSTVSASMFNTGASTTIRNSKILKPFTSKPRIKVSQAGQATAEFSTTRKAVNIVKAPLGLGFEEVEQYEIEEAVYGGAANNIATFTQHENGGNGNAEVGDWYANDITAALIAAGKGIGSKEFILSGIYGTLGSVVTVTMPHRGIAADGTKLKNPIARGYTINGNRESNLDIAKRLMPLTSPIYAGYKENKALLKDAELTANEINKWILDPENQAKFSSVNGTINWMKTILDAADSGDEFEVRNGQLGKSVHDALMLEKILGTELHDAIMTLINEVVNLQEGTKEANDYVEAMRNRTDTKAETENMSDKEVIDLLKKNANKMVSRMETVLKYGKEIENLLGDLDIDTKHSLVYARMLILDWKERSKKIADELSRLDIKSSTDRSSLTADAKLAIAKHGSLTKALENKTALEGKIETLKLDIKILKKKKKLSTAEEKTLQSKKIELSRTEKDVKLLGNLGETELNDLILNESEIMELDPVTRAAFLNPTERTKFSQALLNVIENLINQGTIDDTEFLNKVRDAAKIEISGSKYLKEYNAVLASPKVFSIYTAIAKDLAAKAIQRRRYDALKNIKDYKEFSVAMDLLLQDGSLAEKQNILSWFRKEETNIPEGTQSNFGKYMVKRGKTAEVLENATRGEVLANAQGNDVDLFTHASAYLEDNDIDITDTDAVTEALSAVDEVGNNLFQKYVEKINANVELDSKTVFTSPTQVILMVKDVVDEYKKNDANAKANSTPIKVTLNPLENSSVSTPEQPANAVSNVAKLQVADNGVGTPGTSIPGATLTGSGLVILEPESVGELATEGLEDKKEEFTSEIAKSFLDNSTEVRTAALEIESLITSSPELTEELKEDALEIIKELGDTKYLRVEDLANAILDKSTWLLNNGNKEIATQLNNFAPRLIISAKDKKLSQLRAEDYARLRELNVVEKSTAMQSILGLNTLSPVINLNANEVSTLDILFLNDKFSMHEEDANFSPLLKYLQDNKVELFLNMDYLNKQTPVFFINDPQLTEALRRAWKEQSNKELPAANASLVAVVKSANGPIEIKGERYLPIGIMPATSAKRYSGSNRLEIVRSQLNTEATEPYLVSDAEGIIETRLSRLPSAQPMQLLTENISTIESGMNSLSFPERSLLESLSRAEQRSNPIYRKMRKKFFESLGVSRVGRPKLIFNIPNLLKQGAVTTIDIFILNVSKSKCINTGLSIISMLKGGDLKVLEANSRIRRWSGKLGDIIGNINESNITILPNGLPTQLTENTLSDLAKDLNKQLGNFLNIGDFTFNVEYAGVLEGNNVYKISMFNSIGETIELGNFSKNITNLQKLNILKNMILDLSGKVRMLNDKYELVKWLIPYNDFLNLDDSKSKSNAEDIYDDGILLVSKERLTYNVKRLTVEAPYTMDGNKRVFAQVTNKDNANISGTSPVSQALVETDTAVIDTNTGTIKEGKEKEEVKLAVVEALKKAELISKGLATVTQTSEGYKINGGIYRVVERQEKEDWKQHINTTIKNIFSNFFLGKEITEHPTMTIRAFEIFKGNIEAFKNGLTSKGITLIPKVIVTATLPDLTTKVALEVHLGYDYNGNWHIYCPTMELLSEAQLKEMASEIAYLSSNFASTYGLTILDITIIPIDIAYPNANKNLRVENGVVFVNKKSVYLGARPILGSRKTFAMNDVATYNTKNLLDNEATNNIKPGVAELFESNPELANTVYEALGINQNIAEIFEGFWNRQQVALQTDKVFLFGDNTNDRTITKYVPSTTQAVVRGLSNAIGIDTKKDRGTSSSSYLTDNDFEWFKNHVDEQIQKAKDSGKTIVIPADGIGTGKAMLKEKAPKLFEYLQQKLNELKNNQITPEQKQQAQQLYSSYLQTTNNPTIKGFKQWNNRQQQVNELFESNPELANEVYETLGFKEQQYVSKLKEITERRKLATKSDLENSQLIKDLRVDKSQPKELKPNAADNNLAAIMLYGMKMSELEDKGLSQEMMEATTLAYRILNDFMFDMDELSFYEDILLENPEYASILSTNENPVKEFFENDIFEQADKEKFEITPEQKQQAQQLYSQYLDTIFPDSKVKDIVYHGTKSKESFEEYKTSEKKFKNGDNRVGFYFTKEKGYAEEFGRVIPNIINTINPIKINEEVNFGEVRKYQGKNDAVIGIDDASEILVGEKIESYVVFEPEQIHILGSKQDIEGFKQWNNRRQQINELFDSNPELANKDRLGVESTEESSKTEAVVTNTTATTNIDLTASYFGEESTDKTLQGKLYVPKGLKWGEWDKLGYNKESTLRNLLDNGITEEEWEEYSDAEKEAELKCKGRY